MAPVNRTPEYTLLALLVEKVEVPERDLNPVAVEQALRDGYVDWIGESVFITEAGYDRFDQLNDK